MTETPCRIKEGWDGAGRKGILLCIIEHSPLTQRWAVVIWDGEEDPDCFKNGRIRSEG